MFISCEKCSTTYTLDDRLISPQGTPVQCTRCGQVFTAKPSVEGPNGTQALGAGAGPAPRPGPSPPGAIPANLRSTLVFGRGAPLSGEAAAAVPPAAPATPFQKGQTQVFGLPQRGPEIPRNTQVYGRSPAQSSTPDPVIATPASAPAQTAAPPSQGAGIDLPPEENPLLGLGVLEGAGPAAAAPARSGRRTWGLWTLALLAGLGGWAGVRYWRRPPSFPPEALEQRAHALNLLRPDDESARAEAQRMLRSVVERHPRFNGARADYLLVLALSWDEAKAALESLQTRTARLEGEKRTLEEAQQPVDWQNRANALSAAVAELSEKGEPLAARERTLGAEAERVVSELRALPPTELSPRDASAWQRAQAVYLGVRGEVGATELVRSYREGQVPGEQDGWAEVALAEYALHADAPAAALSEATEGLKVLKVRDSEFLRAQVLAGRLALKAGNSKEAQTALEAVVTLNPRHQFAQELLTVAQEAVAPAEPRPDPTRE